MNLAAAFRLPITARKLDSIVALVRNTARSAYEGIRDLPGLLIAICLTPMASWERLYFWVSKARSNATDTSRR